MIHEEYRDQVEQRWKETMALLGLEEAAPPEKPKPQREAAEKVAEPIAKPPVRPAEPEVKKEPVAAVAKPEAAEQVAEVKLDEPAPAQAAVRDEGPVVDDIGEEPPLGTETENAEEKAGRRRRGRRGRRGKKADTVQNEAEVASAAPAAEDSGTEEESAEKDNRRRRGRGRGRPRPAKAADKQPVPEDETAETEEATDESAFGEDEPTNPSEWDVPSWQELIASLYRPER